MATSPNILFTVGHSVHPINKFIGLLQQHDINVVADVRSVPFSRFNPQFNKKRLAASLHEQGIQYEFFGEELGARAKEPSCYVDGQVQYALLAKRPAFKRAVKKLVNNARNHRIALMCAEKEPLDCHRTILVSEALANAGQQVQHVLADGTLEPHQDTLDRLLDITGTSHDDLFQDKAEFRRQAVRKQEERIAYRLPESNAG
ncbi:MAG: DUF488 domain-containing protein [Pseudohongiellaceae bacterium]